MVLLKIVLIEIVLNSDVKSHLLLDFGLRNIPLLLPVKRAEG